MPGQLAEKIIPLARGLTQATAGKLIFLRIVQDSAEISTEEEYLSDCARQHGAQLRFAVSLDPARAIAPWRAPPEKHHGVGP